MSDPTYYGVLDSLEIRLSEFPQFRLATPEVFVVSFLDRDLADPKTEPIAVKNYNGDRIYHWRDKEWMEYDLPCLTFEYWIADKMAAQREQTDYDYFKKLKELLGLYSRASGFGSAKAIYRVIYRVWPRG